MASSEDEIHAAYDDVEHEGNMYDLMDEFEQPEQSERPELIVIDSDEESLEQPECPELIVIDSDDASMEQDSDYDDIPIDHFDDAEMRAIDHVALEELHRDRRDIHIDPNIQPLPLDQAGGGSRNNAERPLFTFQLGGIMNRQSRKLFVHEQVVPVYLRQNQVADASQRHLAEELGRALLGAIRTLVERYER